MILRLTVRTSLFIVIHRVNSGCLDPLNRTHTMGWLYKIGRSIERDTAPAGRYVPVTELFHSCLNSLLNCRLMSGKAESPLRNQHMCGCPLGLSCQAPVQCDIQNPSHQCRWIFLNTSNLCAHLSGTWMLACIVRVALNANKTPYLFQVE